MAAMRRMLLEAKEIFRGTEKRSEPGAEVARSIHWTETPQVGGTGPLLLVVESRTRDDAGQEFE